MKSVESTLPTELASDAKAVECAQLTRQYSKEMGNLMRLSTTLREASEHSFVNLFDVLQSHEICDKSRVVEHASSQIVKAVKSFVGRSIFDELYQNPFVRLTSGKNVVHLITACRMQSEVSSHIARATVDTATRGTDDVSRAHIKEALLAQMAVVWSTTCVPLIEAERASLKQDLESCRSLLSVVKRAMRAGRKDGGSTESTSAAYEMLAKSVAQSHTHTAERLRSDPWYGCSALVWPCDAFATPATPPKAFVEWCETHADRFRTALGQDVARLQRLCTEPAESIAWHGLEVVHAKTIGGFCFQPPGYVGRFETPTSRVYAQFAKEAAAPQSTTRAIVLVQAFWVLRHIVQREWLPIRYVSREYALALIESEIRLYSHTVCGVTAQLKQICNEFGVDVPEEKFERVLFELCAKQAHRTTRGVRPDGGCSSTACVSVASTVPSAPLHVPPDTLCDSRDKSIPFRPLHVRWHALVDYAVVHAIGERVSEAIDRGRGSSIVSALEIRADELIYAAEQVLYSVIRQTANAELRRSLAQLTRHDSLRQSVPIVVKALLANGARGCAEFNKANDAKGGHGALWSASYAPDRAKGGMLLTIGYGATDPMLFLVYNLCSRIKGMLDQSWPLPLGVEWTPKRPRSIATPEAHSETPSEASTAPTATTGDCETRRV